MLKSMIHDAQTDPAEDTSFKIPFLPKLVMDRKIPETLEEAAFNSGAAIVLLHQTTSNPALNVPQVLLRKRLALKAAINTLKIERRSADEGEIRDGFLLADRDGFVPLEQAMGPSGFMYAQWRDHTLLSPKSEAFWTHFIGTIPLYTRTTMIGITQAERPDSSPVRAVVQALQDVLTILPKEEMVALQWADITLSLALGWKHMTPLVGCGLSSKDLRRFTAEDVELDELMIIAHTAIAKSARDAIRLCHDLSRRADKLRAVAPKLRAKGSDEAIELFLREDAIAPSNLVSSWIFKSRHTMTPRAARRFCDRLVELGVARELTGRSTFRLYGVA